MNTRKICRYKNRKLYDYTKRGYVNLKEIRDYVKAGVTIQSIDYATKEDNTAWVLFEAYMYSDNKPDTSTLESLIRGTA